MCQYDWQKEAWKQYGPVETGSQNVYMIKGPIKSL